MTEHQKQRRIKYLIEYITGWEYKYSGKAPALLYDELESLTESEQKEL